MEREFEWMTDMGIGDCVPLLFYTVKGGMILFVEQKKTYLKTLKKGEGIIINK